MGSFSFLSIDGYPILNLKNNYDAYIKDHLFYEKELIIESRSNRELNELAWGKDNVESPGEFNFFGFEQSVGVCKHRLELLGHSYKRSKKNFELAKKNEKKEQLTGLSFSGLTYTCYLEIVSKILSSKAINYEFYHDNVFDFLCGHDLMLPFQSPLEAIYGILSLVNPGAIVSYDLSDILSAGYISQTDVLSSGVEKIVILTEGKTDVEFLSDSLKMLYPHLKHFYHFLDFDGYKVEGGGSALVRLIKGLAAANVKHPIIAVFDNDTAGLIEMKKLASQKFPANIKVLKYPDISLAKRYPTIGPQGRKIANVNGKACSIEMYLGKELLIEKHKLSPVRWLDYNQALGVYHGVLEQKDKIQKEFRDRIRKGAIWEMPEMHTLLSTIFKAFQ